MERVAYGEDVGYREGFSVLFGVAHVAVDLSSQLGERRLAWRWVDQRWGIRSGLPTD